MTRRVVALAPAAWGALHDGLAIGLETAWVCTGSLVEGDGHTTFLVTDVTPVAEAAYIERTSIGMSIRSSGWVPSVRAAAREGRHVAFAHSHPGGTPVFSYRDGVVDTTMAPAVVRMTGQPVSVSLLVAGTTASPAVAARFVDPGGTVHEADLVRAVGERLRVWPGRLAVTDTDVHDRQVRTLGIDGQTVLAALRVGVAGLGGHGSDVAHRLVQLGVGEVVGIDDDIITQSTPTRGTGYSLHDVGQKKAEVLARRLDALGFPALVELHDLDLTTEPGLRALTHCDMIVGAVDAHTPRRYLSRLAYEYLVPFLDLGVLVTTDVGAVNVYNRVTWVAPGTTCLECRGRIDDATVIAEGLDPEERRARAGEGYVPDIDTPAPSVVAYTALTVGVALTELLARLFGLTDVRHGETVVRGHATAIDRLGRSPRSGCLCATPAAWGATQAQFLGLLLSVR